MQVECNDFDFFGRGTVMEVNDQGVLDRTARHVFTHGQCHALAMAVHEATGYPMVGVPTFNGAPGHVLVQLPSGELLDANGVSPASEHTMFTDELVEFTPNDVQHWVDSDLYYEPNMDVARAFVDATLTLAEDANG